MVLTVKNKDVKKIRLKRQLFLMVENTVYFKHNLFKSIVEELETFRERHV